MPNSLKDIMELHWLFDMLNHIDLGLVVLDQNYKVTLWNSFMENHSGKSSSIAKDQSLFDLFPEIDKEWLQRKLDNVIALKTPIFVSWEQQPYLFAFKSYRPITGLADNMYQNITLRPLANADGTIHHVCIAVYDVTDAATHKLALSSANRQLEQLSKTDALTELHNRGSLEKALSIIFSAYQEKPTSAHSLAIVDLDYFKKINDQYGHPIGDLVLKEVAKLMSESTRRGDFVGRYGGEEFVVLLPNTSSEGAVSFCEKLRKKIEATDFKTDKGNIKITISLGVAQLTEQDVNTSSWLTRADEALYKAKTAGRNQTVC
ncbi:sensor domain-containing diguanylate cyclase [Marinomonas pollencensis]|uniref:diguanylate cyclase n=1 Tax=Marinomonas pollencensis TaxID=491954 RepID=A0A3E0DLC6_9GAMM|nr:sensor domain-containing diguanylate cyclase [Marinomonas pollencensis]REG82581.1 diguanylate cyclase [Marinomonas pollencensis]